MPKQIPTNSETYFLLANFLGLINNLDYTQYYSDRPYQYIESISYYKDKLIVAIKKDNIEWDYDFDLLISKIDAILGRLQSDNIDKYDNALRTLIHDLRGAILIVLRDFDTDVNYNQIKPGRAVDKTFSFLKLALLGFVTVAIGAMLLLQAKYKNDAENEVANLKFKHEIDSLLLVYWPKLYAKDTNNKYIFPPVKITVEDNRTVGGQGNSASPIIVNSPPNNIYTYKDNISPTGTARSEWDIANRYIQDSKYAGGIGFYCNPVTEQKVDVLTSDDSVKIKVNLFDNNYTYTKLDSNDVYVNFNGPDKIYTIYHNKVRGYYYYKPSPIAYISKNDSLEINTFLSGLRDIFVVNTQMKEDIDIIINNLNSDSCSIMAARYFKTIKLIKANAQ